MQKYVAYTRVSTNMQGRDGLGIAAQHDAVARYAAEHGGEVVATYTEVESGAKHSLTNRPQLRDALAHAKRTKATLCIAKLDRLSRSVLFTAQLMSAGVEFVCVDNPHANRLTIQLLAVMAEHESRCISERTKAAMAAAKARGAVFGATPETLAKATLAAVEARRLRRESATHPR